MVFSSENGFAVTLPLPGISADFHDPSPSWKPTPVAETHARVIPATRETSCSACTQSISHTLIHVLLLFVLSNSRLQRLSLQIISFAHQNIHECHLQVIFPLGLLIFHRIKRLIGPRENLHPTSSIIYS